MSEHVRRLLPRDRLRSSWLPYVFLFSAVVSCTPPAPVAAPAPAAQNKAPARAQTVECLEIAKGADLCGLDVACGADLTAAAGDRKLEADILYAWGSGEQQMGKLKEPLDHLKRAESLYRELTDKRQLALTDLAIAEIRFALGERDAALGLAVTATQQLQRSHDAMGTCRGLVIQGRMRVSRIEYAEAERNFRDALAGSARCDAEYDLASLIRMRDGDRDVLNGVITSKRGRSLPLWVLLGRIRDLSASGDTDSALELIESGRERARKSCYWRDLVDFEGELLSILVNRGETARALELGPKTLEVSERLGADVTTAKLLSSLGLMHLLLDQYDAALQFYQRSLELNQRLGRRLAVSGVMFEIARTHYDRSDYANALKYLDAIDPATIDVNLKMAVVRERARISRAMGLLDQAAKGFEEARALAQQLGQKPNEAAIMADLGELQLARCDIPGALKLFEEALQIAVAANRPHDAKDFRGWIEAARRTKCTKKAP